LVRKQFIIPLLLILALSFSACATLITGKQQVIHIVSNPAGAEVKFYRILSPEFIPKAQFDTLDEEAAQTIIPRLNYTLDSNLHGKTPCYIRVPRLQSDTLVMRLELTGYQPVTHRFKKKWNEASALNFVIPWNWMIDANNGAIIRYSQPDTFQLEEIEKRQ
jgi:hypothetical protein